LLYLALISVDDAMGVSRTAHVARDMTATTHEMRALLDDNVCADDKDERGRALDNIGFRADLDARRVGIRLENLYSAFYAFFSLPIDGRVTEQAMERVASLASRYCLICRVMAPFSRPLRASYTGRRSGSATFTRGAEARLAVRLWRVMLCCAFLRHGAFSRDIKSSAPGFEGWILETDASLTGAGVMIYQRDAQGHEECMGAGAVSLEALGFGQDSSNQNTAEFIGAVVCMACALRMGRREQSLMHAERGRRHGADLGRRAALPRGACFQCCRGVHSTGRDGPAGRRRRTHLQRGQLAHGHTLPPRQVGESRLQLRPRHTRQLGRQVPEGVRHRARCRPNHPGAADAVPPGTTVRH
jgi:hypothetical protein